MRSANVGVLAGFTDVSEADTPENFVTLNSGIVIVARDIEIDEKSKTAFLVRPSIVNGSQTRGELEYYLANTPTDIRLNVSCKFEIVVTNDDDLIGEISIARNFQKIPGRSGASRSRSAPARKSRAASRKSFSRAVGRWWLPAMARSVIARKRGLVPARDSGGFLGVRRRRTEERLVVVVVGSSWLW